jgi:hypothetical protein
MTILIFQTIFTPFFLLELYFSFIISSYQKRAIIGEYVSRIERFDQETAQTVGNLKSPSYHEVQAIAIERSIGIPVN